MRAPLSGHERRAAWEPALPLLCGHEHRADVLYVCDRLSGHLGNHWQGDYGWRNESAK